MPLQRGSRSGFLLDRVFPIEGISLRGPIRGTGTGGKLNLIILAEDMAKIYIKEVFIRYRALIKIILDRDLRFIVVF